MNAKRYMELKNNPEISGCASWAVWKDGDPYDLACIDAAVKSLHTRYVFVGLNASRPPKGRAPWINYHYRHRGSRERIFAPILGKPPFYGAYMTDLLKGKDFATAAEACAYVKAHPAWLDQCAGRLLQELATLGPIGVIILFGNDAARLCRDILRTAYRSVRIAHFAAFGSYFKDTAPDQLREITRLYPPATKSKDL
jgi:hypothetical protein